jgi:hypothetical protein
VSVIKRAGPSVLDCLEAAMREDPELTIEEAIRTVPVAPLICPACRNWNHWHDTTDGGCEDPRCECTYRSRREG